MKHLLLNCKKPILVVGDIILDEYLYGQATRISPEAPVPVVKFTGRSVNLGGAGNVAANIATLGGNVRLVGLIGSDAEGLAVNMLTSAYGINCRWRAASDRPTIKKTRIIANGQQVSRIDVENTAPLTDAERETITEHFTFTDDIAAVVVSDYAKGVIDTIVLDALVKRAEQYNIPVFLDPKVSNDYRYRGNGFCCITPNELEARGLASMIDATWSLNTVGDLLLRLYNCKNLLITRGEEGMTLFEAFNSGYNRHDIPTAAREVFDVSGAGDTVIATLALAYASGYPMITAARIANVAAGIVVGKKGTATVSLVELLDAWEAYGTDIRN